MKRQTSAYSPTTSSRRELNRMLKGLCSNPSLGMMTQSAVMITLTCSIETTMTLSRTKIFPVSLVSRLGSRRRMSLIGTPSFNFCRWKLNGMLSQNAFTISSKTNHTGIIISPIVATDLNYPTLVGVDNALYACGMNASPCALPAWHQTSFPS